MAQVPCPMSDRDGRTDRGGRARADGPGRTDRGGRTGMYGPDAFGRAKALERNFCNSVGILCFLDSPVVRFSSLVGELDALSRTCLFSLL